MRDDRGAVFGMVGRLSGLVALAAVAAYGFVWFSASRDQEAKDLRSRLPKMRCSARGWRQRSAVPASVRRA